MQASLFSHKPRCSAIVCSVFGLGLSLLPAVVAFAAAPVSSQTQPAARAATSSAKVTPEAIETRRKEVEAAADLDEATKKKVLQLLDQAAEHVRHGKEAAAAAERFQKDATGIQQRVAQLKGDVDAQPSTPPTGSLPELEQELTKRELALNELKAQQAKAEAEPANRVNRRKEIRTALVSIPERLAEISKQLETPPPDGEPPLLTAARRMELQAHQQSIQQEVTAFQNELATYDAEEASDWVRLYRDFRTQQVTAAQKEYDQLAKLVRQKRADNARDAVLKARDEAIAAQPILKPYAERNQQLAEASEQLTRLLAAAERRRDESRQLLDESRKSFDKTKARVENVGLTGAIGIMLRKQRAELPDLSRYREAALERRATTEEAQYAIYDFDDERDELADPESIVQRILTAAGFAPDSEAAKRLEQSARDVLESKRGYLDQLMRTYNSYLDALFTLEEYESSLIKETEKYATYIDELVLWIRSSKPLPFALEADRENLARRKTRPFGADTDWDDFWLANPSGWGQLGSCVLTDLQVSLMIYMSSLLLFLALLRFRVRFRSELIDIGKRVEKGTFCEFAPTGRVAFLTVLIAAVWPAVIFFIAWRLESASHGDVFVSAVARGLWVAAVFFLPLEVLRQTCRPNGLADSHFDWSELAVRALRMNLRWLVILGVPLVFVTGTLHAGTIEHGRDWLERVFFIIAMSVLAWFLRRVLRPSTGVFQEFLAYNQGGWIDRLKHVWFFAAALSPVALAVLAFVGYYYTAYELAFRVFFTIWFLVSVLIARSFFIRWLLLRHRRMRIEQARERRAAAAAAGQQETSESAARPPEEILIQEAPGSDLSAQSAQTERLFSTGLLVCALLGLWMIWVDVLPALRFLERWSIPGWTTTVQISEEAQEDDEKPVTRTVEKPITVANIGLCLLIAFATTVTARNLPGLMEMTLLQRLPLDASSRYAITTLSSYGIVVVGTVLGFGAIGIGWSKVQWLATALTFGLAFGLQEIFANFVAGVILLFERPIRVGDVVTVDDVTGVVSRIRIRATTITNWDRKEFVIPNKDFITGRLLNWTLSDKTNRVVIPVGIAYGSDTELARSLLLKVANDNTTVLSDPAPIATFEEFGNNTLNLILRAYLPNLDNRLSVIHELHTAIDQEFRKAGLEIAFPQLDLHIRSMPDKPVSQADSGALE